MESLLLFREFVGYRGEEEKDILSRASSPVVKHGILIRPLVDKFTSLGLATRTIPIIQRLAFVSDKDIGASIC